MASRRRLASRWKFIARTAGSVKNRKKKNPEDYDNNYVPTLHSGWMYGKGRQEVVALSSALKDDFGSAT